jgi:hypothetical protein
MKALLAALIVFTLLFAPSAAAQATYTTGFEPPTFVLGDVNGQDGWGHVSNSPTGGTVEPVPPGSPAMFGTQSLAIRTRETDFFGVSNHLHSASIDPPAGETGSTAGGVAVADPRSHFSASFWFRTPTSPAITPPARGGRFAELNPSSQGPVATDPANRYAQVRLVNSTNDANGLVRVEMGWYTSISNFTVATVAHLNWGEWYRFDYLIHLVDGTDGAAPNDRFTLTIFDSSGTQVATACGSTWEMPWRAGGSFGGSATPRAIDGFDFWSLNSPDGALAGHVDELTMTALDLASPQVTIEGDANVCFGGTTSLTAVATGPLPITSYAWRDASNIVVGTDPTLSAGAGTYTVTITDTLCETVTSTPFVVTEAPALSVAISGASSVQVGETTTLTANVTGGSGTITSYVWRNALANVVGTGPTLDTGAGTYTVEVTDATCGTATSSPFTVSSATTAEVPTASDMALILMLALLAGVAIVRLN